MKTTILRSNRIMIIQISMVILSLMFVKCSDDKDINPDYVGNWKTEFGNFKSVISLGKNSFQTQTYYRIDSVTEYLYSVLNGDLSVISDSLAFTTKKAKVDTAFLFSLTPSHILTELNIGTVEFEKYLGGKANYGYKYEVTGDKLKLIVKTDFLEYDRIP
jgi:hypothetical protein